MIILTEARSATRTDGTGAPVLLRRLHREDEAATAEARAVALPLNDPQRRLLQF